MPRKFGFQIFKLKFCSWKVEIVQIIQRLRTFQLNMEVRNKYNSRILFCNDSSFRNCLGLRCASRNEEKKNDEPFLKVALQQSINHVPKFIITFQRGITLHNTSP
jgi:hypothetical protein